MRVTGTATIIGACFAGHRAGVFCNMAGLSRTRMTHAAVYVPPDRVALGITFVARVALAFLALAYFTALPSGPEVQWRFDAATAIAGLVLYLVVQGVAVAYAITARPAVWAMPLATAADALAIFGCVASDPANTPPTLVLAFIAALNVTLQENRLAVFSALAGGVLVAAAALQWRLDALTFGVDQVPTTALLAMLATALFTFSALAWRRRLREALAARYADQDRETQLLNRRGFDNAVRYLMPLRQRTQLPLVIVLASLDTKNAQPLDDRTLTLAVRQFGDVVRNRARRSDVVARLSPEEFVFLLFDTPMAGSETLARAMVERFNTWVSQQGVDARVSFALMNTPEEPVAIEQLIARARSAVQRAQKHPSAPAVVTAPSL